MMSTEEPGPAAEVSADWRDYTQLKEPYVTARWALKETCGPGFLGGFDRVAQREGCGLLSGGKCPASSPRTCFILFCPVPVSVCIGAVRSTAQTEAAGATAPHDSVKLIKFADDTTLIGLISNNDESAYRREVDRLVSWCSGNNLELNAQKTVEMIVDFRKSTVPPPPPSVMDSPITSVESFRFLGTTITQDLKWEPTISSLIKKAQQRMYFLRQIRKAKLPAQMLVQFYTAVIESILTSSITVWFAGATVRDKQRLQRIVRSAEEVIGRSLPSTTPLRQEAAVHQD
uniref:Alkylated DNA repair protein AlkB homologue 8 N-terminal domain-containing protein n=1 Tax=Knipowitschia caucasica TaxID=637954 RepID=A0AAV2KDK0_KNICA